MSDLTYLEDTGELGSLAESARSHYEDKTLDDIILPGLREQMDPQSLKTFSEAAYFCLKEQRSQRPNIHRLLSALEKALEFQLARDAHVENSTSANHWKREDLEHLRIRLDVIKLATENFDEKYIIGSGGYGLVYKANLLEHFDSSVTKGNRELHVSTRLSNVAIKKIFGRKDTQAVQGFIAEVETLSICKHPNIVSLLGFCDEDAHMIVVYENVSNGSLDDYLGSEGKMTNLTWEQRIKICIDIACGLDYIHSTMEKKQKIIHRDIKSANILLGENLEAKIADFGLSKLYPIDLMSNTLKTQNIAGTRVYLDPEYESTGRLKKESDIYSLGVVFFEILSGRLAYDPVYMKENERGIAPIARQHFEKGTLKEMFDPELKEESDQNTFTLSKGPNQESLLTFSKIAYQCLAETQAQRPKMKTIINELTKALQLQETQKHRLEKSFQEIRMATKNYQESNFIRSEGRWMIYKGEILRANGLNPVVVKRCKGTYASDKQEFVRELGILFEFKHENIIGLIGYCSKKDDKIIVYEYASNGSLDTHVEDASLTWTQRLKIGIDVATGLDFLHGDGLTQDIVIHRDIKSSNILLDADWKAKIANFGLSIITPISNEIDFVVDDDHGTHAYLDPQYNSSGFLTRESDIYSLGVVLCEMMCGALAVPRDLTNKEPRQFQTAVPTVLMDQWHRQLQTAAPTELMDRWRHQFHLCEYVKRFYKEGDLDTLVFSGIREGIELKSFATFETIVYECLHDNREDRPTASKVVSQLKKALEFQEDHEVWRPKLPRDYNKIIAMSKSPRRYSNVSNKDLFDMLSKGILLQEGKVLFSLNSNNGKINEMVSARMFLYENHISHTWRSIKTSRFQVVMKVMDISNLKIQIKINTQFLSPNVIYGAHLVFKFCDPRTPSSQPTYVKLKYKMGSQTFNTYFATWRDDEWMMTELSRFIPHKKDVDFDILLVSLSRYYCGSGGIYIEGIDFRALDNATLRMIPNMDFLQQVPVDYSDVTPLDHRMKSYSC